jgi:hypothetical protein
MKFILSDSRVYFSSNKVADISEKFKFLIVGRVSKNNRYELEKYILAYACKYKSPLHITVISDEYAENHIGIYKNIGTQNLFSTNSVLPIREMIIGPACLSEYVRGIICSNNFASNPVVHKILSKKE